MSGVIDLVRHGETEGNLCLGRGCDPPLNDAGWARMRALGRDAAAPWQTLVSSPLLRCRAFAEELAGQLERPLRIDPRLAELGFGAWEGRPWSDLYAIHGDSLMAFQREPGINPAPGGEPYADFERRVAEAWRVLCGEAENRHCLVVCHAGVIRTILRQVLELPLAALFRIEVPHGCLTRLALDGHGGARLVLHGVEP